MHGLLFIVVYLVMVAFGLLLVFMFIAEIAKRLKTSQEIKAKSLILSSTAEAVERDPGSTSSIANDVLVNPSMTYRPNKREILQEILDDIEPGWEVKKPSATNSYDIDYLCIFLKVEENKHKEARVDINNFLFQSGHLDQIKELVLHAIRTAKIIQ